MKYEYKMIMRDNEAVWKEVCSLVIVNNLRVWNLQINLETIISQIILTLDLSQTKLWQNLQLSLIMQMILKLIEFSSYRFYFMNKKTSNYL